MPLLAIKMVWILVVQK